MFICPNCQGRLVRGQSPVGIYWGCPSCGGRAVSLAVLRKVVRADFVYRVWGAARDGQGVSSRRCPTCDNRMVEVPAPANSALKLDVCKICQFVWFDPNELEAVPTAPAPVKVEKELPQAAKEAMALYEVQRMAEQADDGTPDEEWKYLPAILGLPVETEGAALKGIPWLTWATALVIALVSALSLTNLETVVNDLGLVPAEAWRYGGLTFLSSFFLHGGVVHLAGNLYFLLVFGDNVEDYLGRRRWLLLLFLAALAGDVAHLLGDPHSNVPCSGGISGLITFYALQFPYAKLGFLPRYWWYFSYFRLIQMPAWFALMLWIGLQIWGAARQLSGFTNVSALAHLGGVAVGVVLWLMWREK